MHTELPQASEDSQSRERERLAEMESYHLLEADLKEELDGLTLLAASLCEAPISMVNLLDDRFQITKSSQGIDIELMPREHGLCQYILEQDDILISKDTDADERLQTNPFLIKNPKIHFYAGVPIRNKSGYVFGALCVLDYKSRELTEHQNKSLRLLSDEVMSRLDLYKSKKMLQRQNESLKDASFFLENSSDIQAIIDAHTLEVEYVNKEAVNQLGGKKDEHFTGQFGKNITDPELQETIRNFLSSSDELRKDFMVPVRNKSGQQLYLHSTFTRKGRKWYMTARNETQFYNYQQELKKRSQALESSMDGISIIDSEGRIRYLNRAHVKKYGYRDIQELIGQHWQVLYKEEDAAFFDQQIMPVVNRTGDWSGEAVGLRKDGSQFPQELSLSRLHDGGMVCIVRDITDRKEQENKLHTTLDRLEHAQKIAKLVSWEWIVDTDEMIWSSENFSIFDLGEQVDTLDFGDYLELVHPEDLDKVQAVIGKVRAGDKYRILRHRIITADGKTKHLEIRAERYIDQQEKSTRVIGTTQDITEQATIEQQLQESLKEKETLLAEIHHRVKNNLAVISSLLQLESFRAEDPTVQDVLLRSQMRIQSMAAIHENLYKAGNFNNIPFDVYISDLLTSIQETFAGQGEDRQITITPELEEVYLNVNQALPCGLILNEMMANAFKHAFSGRKTGEIGINIRDKDGKIILEVSDNGVGLVEDFDSFERDSLGFTLIKTLIQQLQADISVDSNGGTNFRVEFRKSNSRGSSSAL